MEPPEADSEWEEIYDYFSKQETVYGGPVCHAAELPEPFELVKALVAARADAQDGFESGLDHSSIMVAAYCALGLRRLIAQKLSEDSASETQLRAELESLLESVSDRRGKVKFRLGSFGLSKTLKGIVTGS